MFSSFVVKMWLYWYNSCVLSPYDLFIVTVTILAGWSLRTVGRQNDLHYHNLYVVARIIVLKVIVFK